MKLRVVSLLVCLFGTLPLFAEHQSYKVARVHYKNQDWVFVKVPPSFFSGDMNREQREYTDIRACARESRQSGHVFAVGVVNRKFKFYGPKDYFDVVRNLDMAWVNARINGDLECDF